jgi:hypothetical protein
VTDARVQAEDTTPKKGKELTYEQSQAKIIHEHTLINHRMTWLVLSQAFLLASYLNLRPHPVSGPTDPHYQLGIPIILYCIVVSGIFLCCIFGLSFYAAFWAINVWRDMCDEKAKRRVLTSRRLIHFFGDAPPAVISLALLFFWAAIFYSDYSEWFPKLAWYEKATPLCGFALGLTLWMWTVKIMFKLDMNEG